MKRTRLKRGPAWVPTVIVLAVVLLAGSRLVVLSVQEHAQEKRESAQVVATRSARAIEQKVQALAQRANGDSSFVIDTNGNVQTREGANAAIATALATEWRSIENQETAQAPGLFGPVRYGSQWIVAARVPVSEGGWSFAYAELDPILASVQLSRLAEEGYDFELTQVEPASRQRRVFASSRTSLLSEPARRGIRAPSGFAEGFSGNYLELGVKPRTGWYPARELATAIGLLAVTAWLLAFGTHDLTHSLQRTRDVLFATRRKLHKVNHQLMSEIEQRQSLQQSFDHARYHDAFTGLPNRRYFMDQLDRALRELRTRRRQAIAIVLIDIDRFRLINDTLGHTAGDELVVQTARRFEEATRGLECVLARWGADQFAVLVSEVASRDAAINIARMLQASLQEPIELRKHRLSVAASAGVTCVESGLQRAEDALREADIALSVAKKHDGAKTIAYTPSMGGDAASLVSLEADLHVALPRNELRLLFQPVMDLRDDKMVGVEALLRWRHPVEGLLTPDRFLAIAEEAGLIVPITRWIVQRVCKVAGDWRRRLPPNTPFYISINLSPAVLRDPTLSSYVAQVLEETHTPAWALKFELTEGGLISNVGAAREVLHRFHVMGIELMLDDFGTGYSSLSHLQLFPFDYVKIDRPFVDRTGSEHANSAVAAAIVQMATSLGLKTIAEIVESAEAARALEMMGCDFGQGYFFSPPVEAEEALQRLRTRGPMPAQQAEPQEDDSPTLVLPAALITEDDFVDEEENRPQRAG